MNVNRRTAAVLLVCTATAAAAAPAPAAAGSATFRAGVIRTSKLIARVAPSRSARAIRILRQFRSDYRPTEILAVAQARDAKGRRWLKLSLPMRPNGRYGWVRADLVSVHPIAKLIVVARGSRRLSLYDHGKLVFRTRIAVGRPGIETPLGFYYIQARYKATEPALGAFAFETSAYSRLSDWPGGGIVGIHGTPWPQLLGKAVSHGCIRVSNAAALTLKRLVPVGTPIRIVR